ncbi:MAG TPA: aldose epimerase family protein [Drouetiella sp.]
MSAELLGQAFGTLPSGEKAELFTLKNKNGATAKVTNYGATLTELWAPDRDGNFANIVVGFDNLQAYLDCKCYYGATVGRYANRIANGKFSIDGKDYKLPLNNNTCTLHGGKVGFDKVLWNAKQNDSKSIVFKYRSNDMEEGFPGNLDADVTYRLTDDNKLEVEFRATTDAPTAVNMTNHSYFNLHGVGEKTILDHEVMIDADHYVPVDTALIPTGDLVDVTGTPFDFRKSHTIGSRAKEAGGGYDHNFCLNKHNDFEAVKAEIRAAGRRVRLYASQPGLQIFTSSSFHELGDKSPYYDFSGLALETQHWPDSINQKNFPGNTILREGETYFERFTLDFNP